MTMKKKKLAKKILIGVGIYIAFGIVSLGGYFLLNSYVENGQIQHSVDCSIEYIKTSEEFATEYGAVLEVTQNKSIDIELLRNSEVVKSALIVRTENGTYNVWAYHDRTAWSFYYEIME